MAQSCFIFAQSSQFAMGHAAALGKPVAKQIVQHVNRSHNTDGSQPLFTHPAAHHQRIGNVGHG